MLFLLVYSSVPLQKDLAEIAEAATRGVPY